MRTIVELWKNAAGYHPGSVAPSTVDGAPLNSFKYPWWTIKSDSQASLLLSAPPTKTTHLDIDVMSDDAISDVEKPKKEAADVDDARRTSSSLQMLKQVRLKSDQPSR